MCPTRLTRTVRFSAAHRYRRPEWSEEENRERFGRAGRPHGHDYRCEVTVEGPVDPETGMLVDLRALDRLLAAEVVEPLDHSFLNDLPEFGGDRLVPTTENIARVVWERLAARLPEGVRLRRVRVREGPELWADYTGEG